jgi:hypothetical protein
MLRIDLYLSNSYLNSSSRGCGKCGKGCGVTSANTFGGSFNLWKTCGKNKGLFTAYLYLFIFSTIAHQLFTGFPQSFPQKR